MLKGTSALSLIVYDHMHCIFQGVTKKLLTIWFDVDYRNHPSSQLPFTHIVDERLKRLTPPPFINRMPRKVSEISYWKASELETFLLVYSLPVLANIMDEEYFEYHILLVHAISFLNFSSISDGMVETARRLLTEYVMRFEYLYGKKCMTCNVYLNEHYKSYIFYRKSYIF